MPTTSICALVSSPLLACAGILFRKLNPLAQRVAIGPELLRQHFVDDRNLRRRLMHRFRHVEGAAAQQRQAHGFEIIRTDAVQVRT